MDSGCIGIEDMCRKWTQIGTEMDRAFYDQDPFFFWLDTDDAYHFGV